MHQSIGKKKTIRNFFLSPNLQLKEKNEETALKPFPRGPPKKIWA